MRTEASKKHQWLVSVFGTTILARMCFVDAWEALVLYWVTLTCFTVYAHYWFPLPDEWRRNGAALLAGVLWPLWILATWLDVLNCRIEVSWRAEKTPAHSSLPQGAQRATFSQQDVSKQPTYSNAPEHFGVEEMRDDGTMLMRCHWCKLTVESTALGLPYRGSDG